MLQAYRQHEAERRALGIPPLPLSKQQTTELVALLKNSPAGEEDFLVELLTYRVPAGVDEAAARARLLNEFGLEIGAGLGALAGKVWRIGLMGESSRPSNVRRLLLAMESELRREGHRPPAGDAMAAADRQYAERD